MIPELITVSELAERLRSRPAKIRALANRGELAFYRHGRAMLFSPEDVAAYLSRAHRGPVSGPETAQMTARRRSAGRSA